MKKHFLLFGFLMLIFSGGCAQDKDYDRMLKHLYSWNVDVIHPKQLSDTIAKGIKVVLLDSREPNEFNVSHLSSAINIGYDNFRMESISKISKEDLIVVYCSVGYRSEKIGKELLDAGYKNVLNLYGGIFEWVNEGHGVVDNSNQSTTRVHAYSKSWGIWLKKGVKVYD